MKTKFIQTKSPETIKYIYYTNYYQKISRPLLLKQTYE